MGVGVGGVRFREGEKTLMASAPLMIQIEPDERLALPLWLTVSLTLAHYAANGKMSSQLGVPLTSSTRSSVRRLSAPEFALRVGQRRLCATHVDTSRGQPNTYKR